ncbi:laminin subunit beta-1 isoform X1 [Paramormyrops kingsleyae]|uniref:laminin subunit beta-1 isoform X1 n=2 Tax=Paramormyrops kingsleyae TaxID=1676925 RepID=UPI003B97C469
MRSLVAAKKFLWQFCQMGTCCVRSLHIMAGLFSLVFLAVSTFTQDLPSTLHGCTDGSCYPATGNLLIGRAANLTATSTCGLHVPEQYCIVSHLLEKDKCFSCNSKSPYDPIRNKYSHRVENVIYLKDRNGNLNWWQSVNGEENVTLRLDLEAEFHFTHLIMKFRTFRPAAMVIERSMNFGQSWNPYRYFSYNCTRMFPYVPARAPRFVTDVICEERYSNIEPSSSGEIIYKVLDPAIHVKDPYSRDIQDLLRITNLRVRFIKLHTLGDNLLDRRPDVLEKYYYAVYELVVRGSCFCYGHASECTPVPGITGNEVGMIHGRCVCKHNTEGLNCEHCKDFHQDVPWRPAELGKPHTCKECNCNRHSNKCHFDMAVYLATGNVSGGVCDNCQHNTMGRNCEMCKPFYYQDPARDIRDPAVCVPCDCDPMGSLKDGECDSYTNPSLGMIAGQCHCKLNVRGMRCDYCRDGFFGLSESDPQGCQPCHCDPRGIVSPASPCDQISGDCACKRHVTGRYCSECQTEYWGLSNDVSGCRPCDCDFGGAYDNRCITEDGQCKCLPHLVGRQCSDVQSGYFCASLDFYKYEAEEAEGLSPDSQSLPGHPRPKAEVDCVQHLNNQLQRHRRHRRIASMQQQRAALRRIRQLQQKPDIQIINRVRTPDQMVTWTGPGFARVKDGAGLVFTINNISYAMDYDILIRYEPESTEDWEAIVSIRSVELPSSTRCGNVLPTEQIYTVTLPHHGRYSQMPRPFCFEPNNRYIIAVRFQRHQATYRHLTAFILIDSLVLIPKYTDLPGFLEGTPASEHRRKEMLHYMCVGSFMMTPLPPLAEMCTKLICSISAVMHNGALPCNCNLQGSLSTECEKVGGQCQCKSNVVGRQCDQCAPGTYGFGGPYGCTACECHKSGSHSHQCDLVTGQCPCRAGASGQRCADCQPGQWGFPYCRPCQCNGHADDCNSQTGACHSCRDYTTGDYCDRCVEGFYGHPVLGSAEHCRPCPCPGNPGTGHSCHAEHNQIVCHCRQGYTGSQCDRCAPGYFGDPERQGGECRPCQCNNNIDPLDPESCDPHTGQCLKCLYYTAGPSCSQCREGYYGNALLRDCRYCTCVTAGTLPAHCTGGHCSCDQQTGACLCRPSVVGRNCDQCAANHWNFGTDWGCEPCGCHPDHAAGSHCNQFSGQCHCRPGFGGRNCSECPQFSWGDPEVRCQECNCHPEGSRTQQCNPLTGECDCVEKAMGRLCDTCARGYTGRFPHCNPCHPCFKQWDTVVQELQKDLDQIRDIVRQIQETGVAPGIGDSRIRDLERKLATIRDLIGSGVGDEVFELISQALDELREEIALTDGRLMGLANELNDTAVAEGQLRWNLTQLEEDLRDMNITLAQKRHDLDNLLNAGFAEQFERVRKYYRESQNAEHLCNSSVSGPDSPVTQSADTRQQVEDLLASNHGSLLRMMAAQNKSLANLQMEIEGLDQTVRNLSEKVCGGHGNLTDNGTCPKSLCGGSGCKDNEGQRHCGGEGCSGTVSAAARALTKANNVTQNINIVNEELDVVAKKLRDVRMLTSDVKMKAMETLEKAQSKKAYFENSNKKLKDFIKEIRDFLTEEGADPESIEKVAQKVLNISLPLNASDLLKIVEEIKKSIVNLTNTESIFNHTFNELQKAMDLLQKAKDVKMQADGVKDISNQTKQALEDAQKAVDAAKKALRNAEENLNNTNSSISEMASKLNNTEQKLMDAMMKLANLSEALGPLQNKTKQNRQMAWEARAKSDNATQAADGLQQEVEDARKKYKDLQDKIKAIGGGTEGLDNIRQRTEDIKRQAEDLLNKANKGMEDLQELEDTFQNNEKVMQAQKDELEELEKNITLIMEDIREKVKYYSTCLK